MGLQLAPFGVDIPCRLCQIHGRREQRELRGSRARSPSRRTDVPRPVRDLVEDRHPFGLVPVSSRRNCTRRSHARLKLDSRRTGAPAIPRPRKRRAFLSLIAVALLLAWGLRDFVRGVGVWIAGQAAYVAAKTEGNRVLLLCIVCAVLCVAIGIAAQISILVRKGTLTQRDRATVLVLGLALAFLLIGHEHERYLLILPLLLLPLGLAGWKVILPAGRLAWIPVVVVCADLVSIGIKSAAPQPPAFGTEITDWGAVVRLVQSNHLQYGFGDFWDSYPLTFFSGERVIVSPKLRTEWGSLSDRYPAYTKAVEDSDSVFALVSDRLPERSLVETALTSGCSAKVTNSIRIPGATLFWPIDRANGFRIWMQEGRIPPPGLGCREK